MRKKFHWAAPGFTCLALLALTGCLGSGGGGSSSDGLGDTPSMGQGNDPDDGFETANPYADPGDEVARNLGNLTVFGDSYSDPKDPKRSCSRSAPPCIDSNALWSNRLVAQADNASLETYARGEASANDVNVYYEPGNGEDPDNTLRNQVDQWALSLPQTAENDLAIVYMGYNDIEKLRFGANGEGFDPALAAYEREVDRLLALGAGAGDGKVFVTLVHDWGAVPAAGSQAENDRIKTLYWNEKVAEIANERDDVVAVDMFTVFDRVVDDPAAFGFTNVTTADAANSDDTALYFDSRHFGERGQEIIAEVYNHYLTRGWDWANSMQTGAATVAQLHEDIDEALANGGFTLAGENAFGFSTFLVGEPLTAYGADDGYGTPARASFNEMRRERGADQGVGMAYGFEDGTRIGFVTSEYGDGGGADYGSRSSRIDTSQQATSFFLDSELNGLELRTMASFSEDSHARHDTDGFTGRTDSARFGGETMAISQRAALPRTFGAATLTPWVDITHSVQEVDSYTISNPLTSDATYEGSSVRETWATIGLDAQSQRFTIGDNAKIGLDAGISYRRSLYLDDYEVRISEAAFDGSTSETLARETIETVGVRLGAGLAIGEELSLRSDYQMDQELGGESDHSLMLRLGYRF